MLPRHARPSAAPIVCRWAIELRLDDGPPSVLSVTDPMEEDQARRVAERAGLELTTRGASLHPGFTTWSLELVPVQ